MKVHSWIAKTLLLGSDEETCPRMELVQESDDEPRVIRGPGYLKGGPDGQLRFKIFAPELEGPFDALGFGEKLEPGTIIPHQEYYRLTAVDRLGDTWTSRRLLPSQQDSSVVGNLAEIRCTRPIHEQGTNDPIDPADLSGGGITLWFDGSLELQFNAATLMTTKIETFARPDRRIEDDFDLPSFRRNVIRFSSGGCDFDVVQEANYYILTIRSSSLFPPYVTNRVVEALQLVLGKTVSWRVSDTFSGGRIETVVRSSNVNLEKSHFQPPLLPGLIVDIKGESTIRLFDRYFHFLLCRNDPDWHPCSMHLQHAIMSSGSSVGAYALGLGVAVEGVCNTLYENLVRPSDDEASLLQHLIDHLESWPATADADADDDRRRVAVRLLTRARGSLSSLGEVRAMDRMIRLVKLGAVEERHVKAWKKLRNPSAHAELPRLY